MRRFGFPGAARQIAEKAKRFLVDAKPPARKASPPASKPLPPPPPPPAGRGKPLDGMRRLAARKAMALAGKRKPSSPPPPPPRASDEKPLLGQSRCLRSSHVGKSFVQLLCHGPFMRSCIQKPSRA